MAPPLIPTLEPTFGQFAVIITSAIMFGATVGTPLSISVMFVDLQESFGIGRANTAAVHSTCIGILFAGGVIPGYLVSCFGSRSVLLAGSVLATIGMLTSVFVTSIEQLILTTGVVGGLGFCFLHLTILPCATSAVGANFKTIAIALCMVSAALYATGNRYLIRYIVDNYNWRATFVYYAAVMCHTLIGGLVISSVKRTYPVIIELEVEPGEDIKTEMDALYCEKPGKSQSKHGEHVENRNGIIDGKHSHGDSVAMNNKLNNGYSQYSPVKTNINSDSIIGNGKEADRYNINEKVMHEKIANNCDHSDQADSKLLERKIIINDSILQTSDLEGYKQIKENSLTNDVHGHETDSKLVENQVDIEHGKLLCCENVKDEDKSCLNSHCDIHSTKNNTQKQCISYRFRFFTDPMYIVHTLHVMLCIGTVYSVSLMQMDVAKSLGFDQSTGVLFLTVVTVASLVARLLTATLDCIPRLDSMLAELVFSVIGTVALLCLGFAKTVLEVSGTLCALGLSWGGLVTIFIKCVLDLDSVDQSSYPVALGMTFSCQGIVDLLLPILIGYSVDQTGSYLTVLLVLTGICTLTTSILAIGYFKTKWSATRSMSAVNNKNSVL